MQSGSAQMPITPNSKSIRKNNKIPQNTNHSTRLCILNFEKLEGGDKVFDVFF